MHEAVAIAAELCRHFEGLRLQPYICPAGYPTQGYGTVWRPDGRRVSLDDPPIDQATAEAWLQHELAATYLPGVLRESPKLAVNTTALGAMVDFAYNLGVPRYRSSTLRRRIDAGNWPEASAELSRWVFASGRRLPGLVRRRAAEAALLPA